eukprot:scaffold3275_cov183-Ochromonas_danica.AAC.8
MKTFLHENIQFMNKEYEEDRKRRKAFTTTTTTTTTCTSTTPSEAGDAGGRKRSSLATHLASDWASASYRMAYLMLGLLLILYYCKV